MDGSLALACSWHDGRSRLTTVRFEGMARASRPLRDPGGAVRVITSALGPGLLSGDRIRRDVEVAGPATLVIAGQMATPVFAGPLWSRSDSWSRIGAAAALYVPAEPLVLSPGARHESYADVDIASDGFVLTADVIMLGKGAHLRSRFSARIDGRLAVRDATDLEGDGSEALLTAIVVSADPERRAATVRFMETLLAAEPAIRGGIGATDGAVILRARAHGAWPLQYLLKRLTPVLASPA